MRILLVLSLLLWLQKAANAQSATTHGFSTIALQDLVDFNPVAANWQIAGNVHADLLTDDVLNSEAGKGTLVNLPDKKNRDALTFKTNHGDMDLELEFMMARHSNSGIYLQGRYEVQLLDSWGIKHPTFGDCGGIYERWDEQKPEGQKGYQGVPPRINACKAPGLWQTLRISFQAPRFDAAGNKIANARILRMILNGAIIHENLELTGPTRGAFFPGESASGPIVIQGDHGPVAFRNIRYQLFNAERAQFTQLQYSVLQCEDRNMPDVKTLKVLASGKSQQITHEITRLNEDFVIRYSGIFKVPVAGNFYFKLTTKGGGQLKINGLEVLPYKWWEQETYVQLPAGEHPFELLYFKPENWYPNGLGLVVGGPGFRAQAVHPQSSLAPAEPSKPIWVEVGQETNMLRSFIDFSPTDTGKTHRIIRGVSVGFPGNTCYAYNAGNGALVQAWKGGFLDATPMWDSRGDGSSRPNGVVLRFSDAPALSMLPENGQPIADTLLPDAHFRPLGYSLDADQNPTFSYQSWGATVQDLLLPMDKGQGLKRTISAQGSLQPNTCWVLGTGAQIEALPQQTYLIDGRYFIKLNAEDKAMIRKAGGRDELIVPAKSGTSCSYSIIW
jgi:hypothetical protein